MFKQAIKQSGLNVLMGTDAGAGAHGHNADEIITRVREGGQSPMDAITSATSLYAQRAQFERVASVPFGPAWRPT